MTMTTKARRQVGLWLLCGVFMVFVQIILGGITRLTGSGLSITKWEIITGTIPPLNAADWEQEFNKYKATPQYQQLNEGMSLSDFKFIYRWEYVHRLWARLMGFVFAIPFIVFLIQRKLSKKMVKHLVVIIILASLVASFGWIMVKSGLVDRPWVNPYKLTLHLSLALLTYGYILWQSLKLLLKQDQVTVNPRLKRLSSFILLFLCMQLVLGGLMSGMKAGLLYPTFPDMNGRFIPEPLLSIDQWTFRAFLHYDRNPFAISFVHFFHRLTAYLLVILITVFAWKGWNSKIPGALKTGLYAIVIAVAIQVLLGILTVLHSKGMIPVTLGVLHQAGAILLLTTVLFNHFLIRRQRS